MYEELDLQQRMAVEALRELKRICDRHGIRFYLLAGSVLGGVRHGGMIPWDDDVDVGLRRDEWLQLRKILPKELDPRFQYVDEEIYHDWPRVIGKILYEGRNCVDLFLIARWTKNRLSGSLHWAIKKFFMWLYLDSINQTPEKARRRPEWSNLRYVRAHIHFAVYKAVCLIARRFSGRDGWLKIIRWNANYFEKNRGPYINIFSVYSMQKEMLKEEWVDHPSQMQYEGDTYDTVGDVHAYLTHLYGDYMKLPPEEKRKKIHNEIFDLRSQKNDVET